MPFHASSLAMVQSTETCKTSPACTHGRARLRACAARIFWVRVIGWEVWAMRPLYMASFAAPCNQSPPYSAALCFSPRLFMPNCADGVLVRAAQLAGFALPRTGGPRHPHARGGGGGLRRQGPALQRFPAAHRGAARPGAALPPARAVRALQAGPAGLDRRVAVRPRVPRAAHGAAGAGRRRGPEAARRPPLLPGARPRQAALGAVARGGPGSRPFRGDFEDPPLH